MATNSFISADTVYSGLGSGVHFNKYNAINSPGGGSCMYPPPRLAEPKLGQCNTYLTGRPHLSLLPYRTSAYPIYPDSDPAHFARDVAQIPGAQWPQPDILGPNPACFIPHRVDNNPIH